MTAVPVVDHRLPFARLLHRGLGLTEYFEAADRALVRLVPFDASCWLSLDPATLLPTSHFSHEYGFDQLLALAANEYLELVAQLFLQQCAPRLADGVPPGPDGWFQANA